jgi:hypothetical protein
VKVYRIVSESLGELKRETVLVSGSPHLERALEQRLVQPKRIDFVGPSFLTWSLSAANTCHVFAFEINANAIDIFIFLGIEQYFARYSIARSENVIPDVRRIKVDSEVPTHRTSDNSALSLAFNK